MLTLTPHRVYLRERIRTHRGHAAIGFGVGIGIGAFAKYIAVLFFILWLLAGGK